jgi:hypothetical protein
MSQAETAHTTGAPELSPRAGRDEPVKPRSKPLFHTPLGLSTKRPGVDLPPIDCRALMQNAHRIAVRFRPHMASYREALAYGLRTAWEQYRIAHSFAMLRAQVKPRTHTAAEIEDSRQATRRCGSSYVGM